MRAVVFDRPHHFRVMDVDDPRPRPEQVRLRTVATGICGTDRHLLAGGFMARFPLIPGHEIVAEVESLGECVAGLSIGDLVAVDNTVLCGHCAPCRRDQPLYCDHFFSLGVNGPGGFADLLVARAEKCFPLDGLEPMTAVLTEPLACAIHGADVLALRPGSDVLLFGAGPTGLLLAQLLVHGGAARVTVAAPSPHKLDVARHLGADETVRMDRSDPQASLRRLRALAPSGFDAVIEATGAPAVLAMCPEMTRTGGTVLVYGMAGADDTVPFSPYEIFSRELTIKGSFAQTHRFDRALLFLRTGRIRTDGIITDRFPLERFGDALSAVAGSTSVKAVVMG
ncbi:zinc-dependent alcohol dehydrogenase family protein [Streptomyces coffeae]|uniref:2-deoxy-scyllo-inosamine dehydrogenase n=1 Tax=Streptomyces coffeae TaxID=621382 RepID=A0ABS1NPE1_9ACTN|nr:zinc-dependent alcohol dehydrogenase family protein [Streptomyces coffeae]MBL1101957.1 zinc-dependent alcohol dehydrogenase family protein [Streptomyces coffeae]